MKFGLRDLHILPLFVCGFCKSGTGTAVFPTGHKRHYIYLSTLKPCNTLSKERLGSSVQSRSAPPAASHFQRVQTRKAVHCTHGTPVFLFTVNVPARTHSALNLLDSMACRAAFLVGQVFSDIMPRKLAEGCRPFGGVQCVHLQGQAVREQ
jgi:hypothetical protein